VNPLILDNILPKNSNIIVALDYDNERDVMSFVAKINPSLCKLKVGKELFTACGPKIIEKLIISGYDVFLDLKFHDIPNTVYKACKAAANLGVWMLNVHTSGGIKMMDMAKQAIDEATHKPLLIGVTVLTSMSKQYLQQIGVSCGLDEQVDHLAALAYKCGLDGVVCSALESIRIKEHTSANFLTVTPGIRLDTKNSDDQTRIVTPVEAMKNKVDYMVIGRPITQANNPYETLVEIYSSSLNPVLCQTS